MKAFDFGGILDRVADLHKKGSAEVASEYACPNPNAVAVSTICVNAAAGTGSETTSRRMAAEVKWRENPGARDDSTTAGFAILAIDRDDPFVSWKIGGLSRFNFDRGGRRR